MLMKMIANAKISPNVLPNTGLITIHHYINFRDSEALALID